jgi:hypothetical protein
MKTLVDTNPWVGSVVTVTASSLEHWRRCRRLYRSRHLLGLPELDAGSDTGVGLLVHRLLEEVHLSGSCSDERHVAGVVEALAPGHAARLDEYVARHASRCPSAAGPDAVAWCGHEFEVARFHHLPVPMWMATGKIDAAWAVDGVLEVRDYKTGRVFHDRVGDDLAARVQVWLVAPLAASHGCRLRVVYEHLDPAADQWPEPYEPEPDDVDAIGGELAGLVAEIVAETEFAGVSFPSICGPCGYRSICPDAVLSP